MTCETCKDNNNCTCAEEKLKKYYKLKIWHEQKAEEYARLIREELLKKKLRL